MSFECPFFLEWFFNFFLSLLLDSLGAQVFLSTSWLHPPFLNQDQATQPQQECQQVTMIWVLTCPKVRCTLIAITSWYLPDFFSVNLWIELDGRIVSTGLPWWLSWQRICLQCRRPGFNPWVGKIPWRREWLPTPGFLPGESLRVEGQLVGWRIPWTVVHGGRKELDMTELLSLSLGLKHIFSQKEHKFLWKWVRK